MNYRITHDEKDLKCGICKKKVTRFSTIESLREYLLTYWCEKCQTELFDVNNRAREGGPYARLRGERCG